MLNQQHRDAWTLLERVFEIVQTVDLQPGFVDVRRVFGQFDFTKYIHTNDKTDRV